MAVLKYLKENSRAIQKEIAKQIGKSERTVKSITVALSAKGIIERKNGKRNGFGEIIKEEKKGMESLKIISKLLKENVK